MNAKTYSPLTCYQNALGDDQTNTTLDALHIILLHDLAWVGVWGAIPGKRGHHESILQGDTPDLERGEESFCGHFECTRKVLSEKREIWTLLASIATIPCFYSTSESVLSTRGSKYFVLAYHHNSRLREMSNFRITSWK
jgi:hypothetical protein